MNQLTLFTKFPVVGATKTRLIPKIGAEGAAIIHRALTERTLKTMNSFRKQHNIHIEISYTGSNLSKMIEWLGKDFSYRP